MPVLAVGKPLESKLATLLVENRLGAGQHRFALVVVDNDGNESAADVLTVTVRAVLAPPIRLRTPVAAPVVTAPVAPPVARQGRTP